jgi:hypothetical protein
MTPPMTKAAVKTKVFNVFIFLLFVVLFSLSIIVPIFLAWGYTLLPFLFSAGVYTPLPVPFSLAAGVYTTLPIPFSLAAGVYTTLPAPLSLAAGVYTPLPVPLSLAAGVYTACLISCHPYGVPSQRSPYWHPPIFPTFRVGLN